MKSADAAAGMTARIIAKKTEAKPDAVLGLATGVTMEQVYAELARLHREEGLDFSRVRTFNLDEYIGLPPESVHSYRYYMNRHLFDQVNIDKRNTHLPDGMAADVKQSCRDYEHRIEDCGGIDLQLLGIGHDGHIGFNEPLSSLMSRTRDKALTPDTIEKNGKLFGDEAHRMPKRALTMGVGTIMDADEVLLLITGASKASITKKALEGPVTAMVTASVLQLHPACKVVLDEAAAAELEGREYYDWVFNHDPDWSRFRQA
jgi:glucosamine-6-phosphate deaminase